MTSFASEHVQVDKISSASQKEKEDHAKKVVEKKVVEKKEVKLQPKEVVKPQVKKVEEPKISIKDILEKEKNHWAKEILEDYRKNGTIKGYADGTIRPNKNITRTEFVTLVNKIFNFTEKDRSSFTDVKEGSWYEGEILKGKVANHLSGYENGGKVYVNPDLYITREDAATIIAKVFKFEAKDKKMSFKDKEKVASYARDGRHYVKKAI